MATSPVPHPRSSKTREPAGKRQRGPGRSRQDTAAALSRRGQLIRPRTTQHSRDQEIPASAPLVAKSPNGLGAPRTTSPCRRGRSAASLRMVAQLGSSNARPVRCRDWLGSGYWRWAPSPSRCGRGSTPWNERNRNSKSPCSAPRLDLNPAAGSLSRPPDHKLPQQPTDRRPQPRFEGRVIRVDDPLQPEAFECRREDLGVDFRGL